MPDPRSIMLQAPGLPLREIHPKAPGYPLAVVAERVVWCVATEIEGWLLMPTFLTSDEGMKGEVIERRARDRTGTHTVHVFTLQVAPSTGQTFERGTRWVWMDPSHPVIPAVTNV